MNALSVAPAWRERLRARADAPPLRPRVPLWFGGERIGSVEADLFERAGLQDSALLAAGAEGGWRVEGDPTSSLNRLAELLRAAGLAHAWRDEQLAVVGDEGRIVGTVERAAVRPLGIATLAVHLTAVSADGGIWLQQRAWNKPSDPGLWDTLVGGLIGAGEPQEQALERETWEEAGLRLDQLQGLRHGGRIVTRRPFSDLPHGYVVEALDWYACALPQGVVPCNQDGEVAGFQCLTPAALARRLEADACTIDAALILLAAHGG